MPLTNDYYIAPEIKKQLDNSKEIVINADQDRLFIITGREGSGKSWLAMQLAAHLDPTLTIDDVCFTAEAFGKRIKSVKKFKAVIFDESFQGLSSKGALSKENKKLIQILIECRQRNLFLFIVLPSIFILDRYIALFRSHVLFNTQIYKKDYKKRYYKAYNFNNKHKLYILGQKYLSYSKPNIWKKFRFFGKLPVTIDKEVYDKKKENTFKDKKVEEIPQITRLTTQRDTMITWLKQSTKITNIDISKRFEANGVPLTPMTIGRILQKPQELTDNS